MSKRFLWGLLLIAVSVIVLLLNGRGNASVSFGIFDLSAARGIVYFAFLSMGVAIGVLIR